MKRTTFYPNIWLSMPYAFYNAELAAERDLVGRRIKELILNNSVADELGVSEMELNITKFSALDIKGNEHHIFDFPGQNAVQIKGMGTGHFMKSSGVVTLKPGTYKSLRFYLGKANNSFTYKDGVVESTNKLSYLDFEIQNNLTIAVEEATEVKLWFDLTPFHITKHLKPMTDWFKKASSFKIPLAKAWVNP
ncbi:MAG: hypothetical protein HKP38_10475 [Croceitalea sp.]|nr:hypothetical protein [Croceitalea sp.]MBT8239190.1 hypothetical protein [Croceitalea sp.]NNC33706.1 hypothetical protein [Croceitalea sp.]NNL09638.1 hypothetical protein [Croceitalea sp.]NNM18610.1 hypothetical protein [Croceitalea sp.]